MNSRDQNNLNYIMNLSTEDFDAWALEITDDELQYALELIQQGRREILEHEQNLMELELAESGFAEANSVLKQFMLG